MAIRADNTVPGASDRPQMFRMDRPVRFGSDNEINIRSEVAGTTPPPAPNNFLLLDDTDFLLLDNTNLLLL